MATVKRISKPINSTEQNKRVAQGVMNELTRGTFKTIPKTQPKKKAIVAKRNIHK